MTDLFWGPQTGQFGPGLLPARSGSEWTATLVARLPQQYGPPEFVDLTDLKWSSVSVTDELAGWGTATVRGSIDSLPPAAIARLADRAAGTELWVYRNGEHVHAGQLSGGNLNGREYTLVTSGLGRFFEWMSLGDFIPEGQTTADYVVTDEDQATIIRTLVDGYQAQEYGHFGLDTSQLLPTGVGRQLTLLSRAAATFARVFSEMGGRDNGFDLWVRPADRAIFASSPRRGQDLSANMIVDTRQITAGTFTWTITPGQFGSDALASSTPVAGPALLSRAADTNLRASFGRTMVTATFSDITRQDTLDAHARQLLVDSTTPVVNIGGPLVPVDVEPGRVVPGDLVTVDYDFGLGLEQMVRRVRSTTAAVDRSGERVALEFV